MFKELKDKIQNINKKTVEAYNSKNEKEAVDGLRDALRLSLEFMEDLKPM